VHTCCQPAEFEESEVAEYSLNYQLLAAITLHFTDGQHYHAADKWEIVFPFYPLTVVGIVLAISAVIPKSLELLWIESIRFICHVFGRIKGNSFPLFPACSWVY
jgi:hypothetical protein